MCIRDSCVSVCLSAAVRPHYFTDLDVTWGRGRDCPLVVHYWADLQSVHGLRCYGNVPGDGGRCQNCAPYMGSGRGWLAGDWPSTGGAFSTLLRRPALRASTGSVLATTRTQNVSKYMLVLDLCLVSGGMTTQLRCDRQFLLVCALIICDHNSGLEFTKLLRK